MPHDKMSIQELRLRFETTVSFHRQMKRLIMTEIADPQQRAELLRAYDESVAAIESMKDFAKTHASEAPAQASLLPANSPGVNIRGGY